ncbi:hypothetical protein RRG08_062479 [Elysia crispata]|uniref:Uncharacterized protein n=1 Tax=Elysia crispata TaxID=231223 RepID=A0AAE0YV86_9GAST|nr:hypothetical protein RRG08_062479 [Elysia crispata]
MSRFSLSCTVRKNVFEKSVGAYSLTAPLPFTDDRPFREPRNSSNPSFIRGEISLKETTYMLHRELNGRGKEKPTVPHRYRPAYNRKRWNCDLIVKSQPAALITRKNPQHSRWLLYLLENSTTWES